MIQGLSIKKMKVLSDSTIAAPLLVKLHDSHRMYKLARDPKPEARTELAAIMSDLLQINLSVAEHEIITDVLMTLISQAEIDLRRAVAERLSVMENVPLRMIVYLANDKIEVADPVLRRSRVLHDMDLIYIVQSKGPEYWRSIALRPCLSDKLIDALVETKDVRTAIHLAENKNITLTEAALNTFTEMAKVSPKLARPFLIRDEVTEKLALKLYEFVGQEIKDHIRTHFNIQFADDVEDKINTIISDFRTSMCGEFIPTAEMTSVAEQLYRNGQLNTDRMIENLRRGQMADFIAMFSVYCALPVTTILEMLHQKSGQGLAVACKAKHVSKPDFVNMFLMTARIRSGKVITQDVLAKALAYYDRIKVSDARDILNQSRH